VEEWPIRRLENDHVDSLHRSVPSAFDSRVMLANLIPPGSIDRCEQGADAIAGTDLACPITGLGVLSPFLLGIFHGGGHGFDYNGRCRRIQVLNSVIETDAETDPSLALCEPQQGFV
jgi:hypothetical protein